jgi:hypothetical protein
VKLFISARKIFEPWQANYDSAIIYFSLDSRDSIDISMSKDIEDLEESPPWSDDSSDGQDLKLFDHWTQKLRTWGVESRGASPSSVWVTSALMILVCAI